MQDPFPRTTAAQAAQEADWIGIYAAEQVELRLRAALSAGSVSDVGAQLLERCLPALEAAIEAQCQLELDAARAGYGFPRSSGYPAVVVAWRVSGQTPLPPVAVHGILARLPLAAPPGAQGAAERWRTILATQTRDWGTVRRTLGRFLGGSNGAVIAKDCDVARKAFPDIQPVVVVLVAGTETQSVALALPVLLLALEAAAGAIKIHLG
jgi:hypothetical protein